VVKKGWEESVSRVEAFSHRVANRSIRGKAYGGTNTADYRRYHHAEGEGREGVAIIEIHALR